MLPNIVSAQVTVEHLGDALGFVNAFVDTAVPLIVSMAILVFVWGVFTYVGAGDNEEKRSQGKNLMWFGVIAIFVMISVWGLVNILEYTFNLDDRADQGPIIPTVPYVNPI